MRWKDDLKGYNCSRNGKFVINTCFLKISPQPKQKYLADKENEFPVMGGYDQDINPLHNNCWGWRTEGHARHNTIGRRQHLEEKRRLG